MAHTDCIQDLLNYSGDEFALGLVRSMFSDLVQHCTRSVSDALIEVAPVISLDRNIFALTVKSVDGTHIKAIELSKPDLKISTLGQRFYNSIGSQVSRAQFNVDLNAFIKIYHGEGV